MKLQQLTTLALHEIHDASGGFWGEDEFKYLVKAVLPNADEDILVKMWEGQMTVEEMNGYVPIVYPVLLGVLAGISFNGEGDGRDLVVNYNDHIVQIITRHQAKLGMGRSAVVDERKPKSPPGGGGRLVSVGLESKPLPPHKKTENPVGGGSISGDSSGGEWEKGNVYQKDLLLVGGGSFEKDKPTDEMLKKGI